MMVKMKRSVFHFQYSLTIKSREDRLGFAMFRTCLLLMLLKLLATTHGQHGDASAGEEDHKLDPIKSCFQRAVKEDNLLEFGKSRVTWKGCLHLMEENGLEGMPRYKDALKSYGQAWYKSLQSGGDERLEEDCAMVKSLGLGHSKEYSTCLSLLALVHDKADDLEKAERRYRQSIALREELGLTSSNDFHVLVCNLGNVLRRARQRDEAIVTILRCVNMFEQLEMSTHGNMCWLCKIMAQQYMTLMTR
jgi:tetratricopeptide (TPR) repeat protein